MHVLSNSAASFILLLFSPLSLDSKLPYPLAAAARLLLAHVNVREAVLEHQKKKAK
jgi:hypothetical protein